VELLLGILEHLVADWQGLHSLLQAMLVCRRWKVRALLAIRGELKYCDRISLCRYSIGNSAARIRLL
jgi:hypothetical protein